MDVTFCYKPLPIHQPFHDSLAEERAAIGGVGSGKTIVLCGDAIWNGLRYPGSKILIARQTVPALRDTTESEFFNLMSQVPDGSHEGQKSLLDLCEVTRSGGHTNTVTLPNGSEFLFRSLDDWKKHMGMNLAGLYIDEASEIDEECWIGLNTRLRQTDPLPKARAQGAPDIPKSARRSALCTNPNGHDWIWERFVRPKELGLPPELNALGEPVTREYFRSTSVDNPYLPPDYVARMLTMPEMWLKRYVMCTFDSFEGQIYSFESEKHVVTSFVPPKDWDRAMGLDWGLRNPTAVVWWARRPGTSVWYQYREWQTYDPTDALARESYVTMDADQVIARIRQIEQQAGEASIKYRVADPAVEQRSQVSGKSVAQHFGKAGMSLTFGMKRYEDRINALTRMLNTGQLLFMDNCPMTTIAIQQYRWADAHRASVDGPERPVKKNDHLVNAAEYLATHFMAAPPIIPDRKHPTKSDEIWDAVRKKQQRRVRRLSYSY